MEEDEIICHACVGENYLSAEIIKKGKRGKCSYCGKIRKSYTLECITERIEEVMLAHYERTPLEPEYGYQPDWYRDGETVVDILVNEFAIDRGAAAAIQERLDSWHSDHHTSDETEFDSEAQYMQKAISDSRWANEWYVFETTLKTESRYFGKKVAGMLAAIFDQLDTFTTYDKKPVLLPVGPGQKLKRFQQVKAGKWFIPILKYKMIGLVYRSNKGFKTYLTMWLLMSCKFKIPSLCINIKMRVITSKVLVKVDLTHF